MFKLKYLFPGIGSFSDGPASLVRTLCSPDRDLSTAWSRDCHPPHAELWHSGCLTKVVIPTGRKNQLAAFRQREGRLTAEKLCHSDRTKEPA